MKVLFVCEDERDAQYVRDNHETLEEALRSAMFWPRWHEFVVVAATREPTGAEMRALRATTESA